MFSKRYHLHKLDYWAWVTSPQLCLGGLKYEVRVLGLGFGLCCASFQGKGSKWMNILICIFFSCLCAQISAQKTVRVQSPENWECLFPRFLVFTQGTLSLFAHHWAFICRSISPNYEIRCTQLSQKNPLHLFESLTRLCKLAITFKKRMFPIILWWSGMVEFLFCFGLDFSSFCCWVGLLRFLGGIFFFSFFFF